MDNDNKINNSVNDVESGVRLFLQDEMQPLSQEKPRSYNLETEYAATKKNKNPFIFILMAVCLVLVGLFAFGISKYVDYKNNTISINIDSFDDLNLKNLLDIVSQTKTQYDSAVNEKSQLEAQLSFSIKQAEQKKEADLFTLKSLKLSTKENSKRKSSINIEYEDTVKKLHEEYDVQISTKQGLIEQYQKQLANYDSSKVEQAKEQEAAIDSQRQLNELEKQKLTKKYESQIEDIRTELTSSQQKAFENQKKAVGEVTKKYQAEIDTLDPVVKDTKKLVEKSNQNTIVVFNAQEQLANITSQASVEYKDSIKNVESVFSNFNDAEKVVSSLPQKNSIPSFVKAMKSFAYQAGSEITKASVIEINRLAALNDSYKEKITQVENEKAAALNKAALEKQSVENQSESYQKYFESLCKENDWGGMLIGLSYTIDLPIYLAKENRIYFTDPAYKDISISGNIKRKNSVIAAVIIKVKDGFFYCTPKDVSKSSRVRVGDWIEVEQPVLETAADK